MTKTVTAFQCERRTINKHTEPVARELRSPLAIERRKIDRTLKDEILRLSIIEYSKLLNNKYFHFMHPYMKLEITKKNNM